jgi:NAD(P)-dependent dehydrogenase (short-subunit alcohol dehydrogenase family)
MHIDSNTVAVVTGAAHGIGRALAVGLAQRRARLALVDVDEEGMLETRTLAGQWTGHVTVHAASVADRHAMEALPREVVHAHGAVHLLVNNAGVSLAAPLEELALEDFDWLMGIDFWGVVHGCKFFLPHLRRAGRAHILNVLSDFALLGLPTKSAYCAAKFAARGFSDALRAELHGSGIGVTAAYPGPVDTDLVRLGRTWDADKRELEVEFVRRRGLPVARVARRMLRAVERNRPRVRIGLETYAIDWARRLLPELTTSLVARARGRVPFL